MNYHYFSSSCKRLIGTLALWACVFAGPALAQPELPSLLEQEVERFLVDHIGEQESEVIISVDVPKDKRQSCPAFDLTLPNGRNIDSRTTVIARCIQGDQTPIYVRTNVQINGVYYVPSQAILPNQPISADLLEPQTGDLLRLPRGVFTDLSALLGRIATQRLVPGRPIRMSATRSAQSVVRGQRVRIEVQSPGLVVTNQGEALATADVGMPVQVRTTQGSIIQAIVHESGVVRVSS